MTQMDSNTTREQILSQVEAIFVDQFDIAAADIALEARLYDDLDIDSIDAVDLMVALKEKSGKKLDPDVFKQVRTVGDIVDAVHDLLKR
ncbi:MAG: acyl carrier protein [Paracoccaceae bacterium]|jgi:acyl carrier protein